jgi:hypothetical protein
MSLDDSGRDATLLGSARISFQYWIKGTLGKKHKALVIDLETQAIVFGDGSEIPTTSIISTSKTSTTPGEIVHSKV